MKFLVVRVFRFSIEINALTFVSVFQSYVRSVGIYFFTVVDCTLLLTQVSTLFLGYFNFAFTVGWIVVFG